MRSPHFMIRPAITVALAVIGATIPTRAGGAAVQAQAAGEECCPFKIVSVDARTGVVAAQETASGRTFRFKVNDAALLSSLAVGESFNTDPAVSTLEEGEAFSMIRTVAAATPLGRPGRALARPTVSRADACCPIVSALAGGNAPSPAGAAARPAGEAAAGGVISRGAAAPAVGAPTPRQPSAGLPPVDLPSAADPPSIEPVNYAIDLVELHCRKIWYSGIGNRDRVLLELWAFDAGSDDRGSYVAHTFNCRNDYKQYLDLQPIFEAAGLDGDIMVSGNFMVTHPQNGQNIIDALRAFADAEVQLADVIVTSELVELPDGVTKLIATFTGAGGIRDKIAEWRGNYWVELFNIIGRAVCAGGNPFTWNKSIGLNPLDAAFFADWGDQVYKLWYISEGAKWQTCGREIKYDLFARIRAN